MKFSKEHRIVIAEKVAELYKQGIYTLESCCQAVGISYDTLKNWAAPTVIDFDLLSPAKQKELIRRGFVPEINAIINQAKQANEIEFKRLLLDTGRQSLIKSVTGYTYFEKVTFKRKDAKGKMRIVGRKTIKKVKPPDTNAIISVLKKFDPDFNEGSKDLVKTSLDHRSHGEQLSNMSTEELEGLIIQLQQDLKCLP